MQAFHWSGASILPDSSRAAVFTKVSTHHIIFDVKLFLWESDHFTVDYDVFVIFFMLRATFINLILLLINYPWQKLISFGRLDTCAWWVVTWLVCHVEFLCSDFWYISLWIYSGDLCGFCCVWCFVPPWRLKEKI